MNYMLDTIEFGVYFRNEKQTPQELLEEIQKEFINNFSILVYYHNNTYDNNYSRLAYELKFRNSKRYSFVAFLHFTLYDIYVPVYKSSRSKYLTFNIFGLVQYNLKSQYKNFYLKNIVNHLFDNRYKVKVTKMDIAIDVDAEYNLALEFIKPFLSEKGRNIYMYKELQTAYFNTESINKLIEEQKRTGKNLNVTSKNHYMRIVCYNKSIKDNLSTIMTRIEFSYRTKVQRLKESIVTSIADIELLVKKLYNISNSYLNNEF